MAERNEIANQRTSEALRRAGLEDPRPALRAVLRGLRERDRAAFAEATSRYEQVLVPELVDGQGDPLIAWLTYAAWLSARETPGEMVVVDRTGRSRPFGGVVGPGELFLHLPADSKMPATKLLAPLELSEPQRETISLLVR